MGSQSGAKPNLDSRQTRRAGWGRIAAAFAVMAGLAAPIAASTPATAAGPPTIVSLTFDHGLLSQYQVRDILKQNGVRATFFINSGHVGTDPGYYMSWEQLQNLYADGNEIGGHT